MLQKMPYRLALDLGSTSLGWAVFLLNSSIPPRPKALVKAGVRIFPNSRESAPIGQQGESLAKIRREKRQARRRRDRLLRRKEKLIQALIKWGLFPQDLSERKKLELLDPYAVRTEGLTRQLESFEFGRALFHLNQRRGFKSNRKTDGNDKNEGPLKTAIKELREKVTGDFKTVGAWLHHRKQTIQPFPGAAIVRAKHHEELRPSKRNADKLVTEVVYDFYIDRKMVEDEFDALWDQQNANLRFPDAARTEIKDIIFYQRKLRPVSPGRCSLLPNLRRAYKAFPIVQQLRIYQEVNHLEILDENLKGHSLTIEQRNVLIKILETGKSLTFSGIRKELKLNVVFNYENGEDKREGITGDETAKILSGKEFFGKRWLTEFDDTLRHRIVWKLLHAQNSTFLSAWLKAHTGIDDETASRIMKAPLPGGVSAFSRRISQAVLQKLQSAVMTYNAAVEATGYGSHSQLSHFEQTGELMPTLPYYGQYLQRHVGLGNNDPAEKDEAKRWGRIANPTVHVGLNQVRKVVNALINKYGPPTEVVIELARPLKLNAKQRERENKRNRENREARKKRRDKYIETFGKRPSDDELERMQLWEELNPNDCANRLCPYTGKPISLTQLVSPSVQIEHILPFSQTLDNSLNNKTVAFITANYAKADRSPFDAFGNNPTINGITYCYADILKRAQCMKREKYMRFAPNGYQWWLKNEVDFPARALTDTQYLSKVAKEYLTLICHKDHVWATPGRLTSFLREHWGFNSLLNGSERKNRNDHRHHAIDACVIGVTDRGLIEDVARASARAKEKLLERIIEEFPKPWPTYTAHVKRAIESIWVSHKPDCSFEGRMFEERAYGFMPDGTVRQQKARDGSDKKKNVSNVVPIKHRKQAAYRIHNGNGQQHYKGYVPYGNFAMEIIAAKNGSWDFDVIPTYVAYAEAVRLGWGKIFAKDVTLRLAKTKLSKKPGNLVMKLVIGDCIAIDENGTKKILTVTKMSIEGGATFTEIHESNVSARANARGKARKKLKENGERLTAAELQAAEDNLFVSQIGVSSLQTKKARRITISPIGEIRDPGFKG